MDMASITILYFASAKSATGTPSETIQLPHTAYPLSSLAALLTSLHPETNLEQVLRVSAWSVDAEMVPTDEISTRLLQGGEEVAVIPPVSGG